MVKTKVPVVSRDKGLANYLQEVRKYPILEPEEEYMLAERWKNHADTEAARVLITSHLRLVAKIALGFRGYGLPLEDVISEGNVGLMKAVKRFEPERGFRLSTYAMWWIRASIQEYILRSWSLVKLGTTAAQKKLFFNLRRIKGQIKAIHDGELPPEAVTEIAKRLNVKEDEVIQMNRRLAGHDHSLNAPVANEADAEWIDRIESEEGDQEESFGEAEELGKRRELLETALAELNERERHIFISRFLDDPVQTLEELSKVYEISRERVRQIEVRAFEKVQKHMLNEAIASGMMDHERLLEATNADVARR